jgi:hypothetical protein
VTMACYRTPRMKILLLVVVSVVSCSSDSSSSDLTLNAILELPPEVEHHQRWEQIEEAKRACMSDEGFEYILHIQPRFAVSASATHARGASPAS